MKNFKKILFSFILICTFFCFSKNVLADTTCNYFADYPFNDSIIVSKPNIIFPHYARYVYTVRLNHDYGEYANLLSRIHETFTSVNGGKFFSSYPKITAQYTSKVSGSNVEKSATIDAPDIPVHLSRSRSYDSSETIADTCPSIILLSPINISEPDGFQEFYHYGYYDISDVFADALIAIDEYRKKHNDNAPMLLVLNDKRTTLEMAKIYIETGYRGINLVNNNQSEVDSIVEKYLKIDGWQELLDDVNLSLDLDNNLNDKIEKIKNTIAEQLGNGLLSSNMIASIDDDYNNLKSFDAPLGGIFKALKEYISPYNLTVSKWYDEYMSNSNTKYIRALLTILPIINDEEIKQKIQTVKDLGDANKSYQQCLKEKHTLENCMSECQDFYKLSACKDSSNISECIKSYPSNVCKNKNTSTIQNDIDKSKEEEKEKLKDLIGKKMTDIYANQGIDISKSDKNDFCNILLGEGKNDGLYPYIRLVLNLIRIAGPILVVLLTAFDGMKVITSFKGDENKKFWNHLKIRLICLVILILVPTIINNIVNLFIDSCPINV